MLAEARAHARANDRRLRLTRFASTACPRAICDRCSLLSARAQWVFSILLPNNPVRTAVVAWKWGAYLGEEAVKNGIRAKISSFARHHINVSLAKAKITGQYTNSVLAKREAKLAIRN